MKVSIIIKALNEEKNIARAIESSLKAIEEINGDGEVILADSLSDDLTVNIAAEYPIKIVQLLQKEDRSCGVGAQLGYTVADGEFIYILDADMEFQDGFLSDAIDFLEKNDDYAGVSGLVEEMNTQNIEFKQRLERANSGLRPGEMNALNMGGLFRASALGEVGYFTHKNLNSYEEAELGARLKVNGWLLKRIDLPGVKHYGYNESDYKLLTRRIKSGYIFGLGQLLRTSFGKPHFVFLLKNISEIKLYIFYFFWILIWPTLFVAGFYISALVLLIFPFIIMTIKKRSLSTGLYAVIAGLAFSLGSLIGWFRTECTDPNEALELRTLTRVSCSE